MKGKVIFGGYISDIWGVHQRHLGGISATKAKYV